ncbi:MAG: methyltransferase domain-containing protein [Planctomycetaceae bacterium]|nr:methyltransferase domain-containing protein [Planctomycetaceae bacterium]
MFHRSSVRFVMCLAGCLAIAVTFAVEPTPAPKKKPDVGFYATTQDVVEEILRLAKVGKDDVVCDLGCGDGRFVITAAKRHGCRGVGYEIDPKYVKIARESAKKQDVEALVTIHEQDIFTVDLKPMTVVTLFLLPELNDRLIPQLEKLPKGARIISHEFDVPGLVADKELTFVSKQDESEHLLYIYTTPLKKKLAK